MYRVISPIQSGSFSTVYKGWSEKHQTYVALKVISKHTTPMSSILNERDIMQMLGSAHPNICSMLDFYEDNFFYVIVLEFYDCGDLYDFLELAKNQGKQGISSIVQIDLCRIIRQIHSALNYAHSMGIAHRDIKPENILLTREGNVKLADWGHAIKSVESSDCNVGTDIYRAPETFIDHTYSTFKADYWAFGVTILYAIFGETPFKCLKPMNNQTSSSSYVEVCKNFAEFGEDPHGFMYHYYVRPFVEAKSQGPPLSFNSGYPPMQDHQLKSSKPILYEWRDFTEPYKVIHLQRIIVEKLLTIDPEKRQLCEFVAELEDFEEIMRKDSFLSDFKIRHHSLSSASNSHSNFKRLVEKLV